MTKRKAKPKYSPPKAVDVRPRFPIDYDNGYTDPAPDGLYIMDGTKAEFVRSGAYLLLKAGKLSLNGDNRLSPDVNSTLVNLMGEVGIKLLGAKMLLLDTVTPTVSSDGLWHLGYVVDPTNPAHFTLSLQYPPDADITGGGATINGAHASTLAAGSAATATIDSAGIVQIGVPRGDTGLTGIAGSNGLPGHDGYTPTIASVTAVTLGYGSPSAAYISADAPDETHHTIPLHVSFGIPIGAPGNNGGVGATGATGPKPIFNQPAIALLPIGYEPTITIVGDGSALSPYHLTFNIPTIGVTSTPPVSTASICDVSETVASYAMLQFTNLLASIASQASGFSVPNYALTILGEFGMIGGVIGVIVETVTTINTATTGTVNSMFNSTVQTAIKSALYCAMTTETTKVLTNATVAAWKAALIVDTTIVPYAVAVETFAQYMDALDISKLNAIGGYSTAGSGDCAAYSCAPTLWSYDLDFTATAGSSTPLLSSGVPRATYYSGQGWGDGSSTYTQDCAIILPFLHDTKLTKCQIVLDIIDGSGQNFAIGISDPSGNADLGILGLHGSVGAGISTQGGICSTGTLAVGYGLCMYFGDGGSVINRLKSVHVEGEGVNPFV